LKFIFKKRNYYGGRELTFEEIKDYYNLKLTSRLFNKTINEIISKNTFLDLKFIKKKYDILNIKNDQILYILDINKINKFNKIFQQQKNIPHEIWYNEGIFFSNSKETKDI
jgi:c-di-AMP phosphodiesterase-like protein